MTILRIRDDDVLVNSSGFKDIPTRFKQYHSWFKPAYGKVLHVANILCYDIQQFPESIEFIKEEFKLGHLEPQIHGWRHDRYHLMSFTEVVDNLRRCQEWFATTFNTNASIFYTPWGASESHLWEAAATVGLELRDTSNTHKPGEMLSALRRPEMYTFDKLNEKEVLSHWWERGQRIERIISCYVHGSYLEAKNNEPELFK